MKMFYQTQTTHRLPEGPKNTVFLSLVTSTFDLWPLTMTLKLVRARDQTRLPHEFGVNPFSSSGDISYTNKKSHRQRQKQNLTQFTASSNEWNVRIRHNSYFAVLCLCWWDAGVTVWRLFVLLGETFGNLKTDISKTDWVKFLHPIWHKIRHFGDILPSQSLGIVLKKLNITQTKAHIDKL